MGIELNKYWHSQPVPHQPTLISVLGDTQVQSVVMAAQVDAGYDLITLEA